jgi:hypothetical protein
MDIALVILFVCRDEFLSLDASVLMVVSKTCNSGFEKQLKILQTGSSGKNLLYLLSSKGHHLFVDGCLRL